MNNWGHFAYVPANSVKRYVRDSLTLDWNFEATGGCREGFQTVGSLTKYDSEGNDNGKNQNV